ncbi:hypothetical protein G9E11_01975 [Arthrobacter sp. IA7]|uniref:hypothetical protein n=1 Tax=Arthrobacter ipis TaxID=2716202 RepID=UPI0016856942|nr:hypothetical protein [Arthrobacter ipis]MBD1541042.1 hypothetical protein [Arthrobacter ipis]
MITEADLAGAWESGYWHGTSREGPLNGAAVAAKNPYETEESRGALAKEHATAEESTTVKKERFL